MNEELLLRVADHIESTPDGFDMGSWAIAAPADNLCDTHACVAGWTVLLAFPELRPVVLDPNRGDGIPFESLAAHLLDLPENYANTLFTSNAWWAKQMRALGFDPKDGWDEWDGNYVALEAIPAKAAAHILRELADGNINLEGDWSND